MSSLVDGDRCFGDENMVRELLPNLINNSDFVNI